jgi:aspartate-semialdehyde dehydrogenase
MICSFAVALVPRLRALGFNIIATSACSTAAALVVMDVLARSAAVASVVGRSRLGVSMVASGLRAAAASGMGATMENSMSPIQTMKPARSCQTRKKKKNAFRCQTQKKKAIN